MITPDWVFTIERPAIATFRQMLQVVRGSYPAKLLLAAVLVVTVTAGYAAATAAETETAVREEAQADLETDT